MNMRKNEYFGRDLRPSRGAVHILQWGMPPIYAALAAIFCEVSAKPVLHVAEINRYGLMLETLLAAVILLTVGAVAAQGAALPQKR